MFVDESGGQEGHSKYYVITLVFHDQDNPIDEMIAQYHESLRIRNLNDIPFHAGPLMTGHDDYAHLDMRTRKMHFAAFFMTLQHLPITYHTFLYKRSEIGGPDAFVVRMRRDIANFLLDELQQFILIGKRVPGGGPTFDKSETVVSWRHFIQYGGYLLYPPCLHWLSIVKQAKRNGGSESQSRRKY